MAKAGSAHLGLGTNFKPSARLRNKLLNQASVEFFSTGRLVVCFAESWNEGSKTAAPLGVGQPRRSRGQRLG
jgi:hypothetical protein